MASAKKEIKKKGLGGGGGQCRGGGRARSRQGGNIFSSGGGPPYFRRPRQSLSSVRTGSSPPPTPVSLSSFLAERMTTAYFFICVFFPLTRRLIQRVDWGGVKEERQSAITTKLVRTVETDRHRRADWLTGWQTDSFRDKGRTRIIQVHTTGSSSRKLFLGMYYYRK